jgi:hypothetical protein
VRWSATFPDAVNPGADGVLSALDGLGECRSLRLSRASMTNASRVGQPDILDVHAHGVGRGSVRPLGAREVRWRRR